MIPSRLKTGSLLLGSIVFGVFSTMAAAQDYVVTGRITAATRCADFGADFIDMGNGVCARVGSTARVQVGERTLNTGAWPSSGTSSATLRSTDEMLPGATVQHLRVRNGLEPYRPFQ